MKTAKKVSSKTAKRKNATRWETTISLPEGVAATGKSRARQSTKPSRPKRFRPPPPPAQEYRVIQPTPRLLKAKEELEVKIRRRQTTRRKSGANKASPLLDVENISCVTIGEKITRGKPTGKACLVIQVKHKRDDALVHPKARIDSLRAGLRAKVATDVLPTGRIVAHNANIVHRPSPGGVSMSSRVISQGTVACVVSIDTPAGGRELCFLGSNHIFAARSTLPPDSWVIQPSPVSAAALHLTLAQAAVARLRIAPPLDFSPTAQNVADCALAATLPALAGRGIHGIGDFNGTPFVGPLPGRRVMKFGCATNLRFGRIVDPNVSGPVDYPHPPPLRTAQFKHLIQIRPETAGLAFSENGDSGALILDVLTLQPIGIVVGGDGSFSYGCHISLVLAALQQASNRNPRIEPRP